MRELRTPTTATGPATTGTAGRPLLAAKMAPPETGDVIDRPRLFARLDDAATRPVSLVVAPAGWGKTVLLTSWLRSRDRERGSAWITVEAPDRPQDLWSYVHAVLPAGQDGPASRLPARPESWVHLAAAVANRPDPVTLVIDGVEHITDPHVVEGLDYLLSHADGRLRLVLAGRSASELPTHRWRLRGALTQVTMDDLAFTTDEVIELFATSGRPIPAEYADRLRDRAEGWPAGLRLAVLAHGDHPEPARFVEDFRGDLPVVADYLAAEVLSNLSPRAVEAFTRCAMDDHLCEGLIDAVTDSNDGSALLADAVRQAGFTVSLGGRPEMYRHHRLLADLLRARLRERPESVVHDLERRSARWHADNGQPARALRHALAAHDAALAESLLINRWRELISPVELAAPPAPEPPPEQVRARPALALAYAADHLAAGDPGRVEAYLRLVDGRQTGSGPAETRRIAAALRLGRARLGADPGEIGAAAEHLLSLAQPAGVAEPVDRGTRGIARLASGDLLLSAGRLAQAEEALTGGVDDVADVGLTHPAGTGLGRLAVVQALRGRLGAAVSSARQALDRVDPGLARERAPAYLALAMVAGERDRPDEVAAHLVPARLSKNPLVCALADLQEARLHVDRGAPASAYQLVRTSRSMVDQHAGSALMSTLLAAADAELRALHGEWDSARDELNQLIDVGAQPAGVPAVALARLHLRAQNPHTAAQVLTGWADGAEDSWPLPVRLAAGLLDADTARQRGDHRRSARLVEQVLALAEPEAFRRVFTKGDPGARELLAAHLDTGTRFWPLVSELLALTSSAPAANDRRPAPPGEPLTERELTILRYLQSVLSNVEIARELSVSVNTVKTHVRSIYRKLDATRRRDAVRRARECHLL